MPPGKRRGAKGAKAAEHRLGDLVLAKVKGFPHWPAKIGKPESHNLTHDPKKYFVEFFGTGEIAFVAPADIQAFTSEKKNELTIKCQTKSKTIKFFAEAVEEICKVFEMPHSSDSNNASLNLASETNSQDAAVDGALRVCGSDGTNKEGPNFESEIIGETIMRSGIETCLPPIKVAAECEGVKSQISPGRNNSLSTSPGSEQKGSVSTSSPSHPTEDGYCDTRVEGNPDGGKLTNGDQPNQSMVSKKEFEVAGSWNSGSAMSHENAAEMNKIETLADGHKEVSSVDNLALGSNVNSEGKDKRSLKEKKVSETAGNVQVVMTQKKLKGAGSRNKDSVISHENAADLNQIKSPAGGRKKVSSADNLTSSLDANRERKDTRLLKKKKDPETVGNVKVAVMKKRVEGARSKNNDSAISREKAADMKQMKSPEDGHKVSSVDNLTSGSGIKRERKEKRMLEEKKDSGLSDNVLVDPEENSKRQSISKKKVNEKRGRETTEVLSPAKISKHADAQDTSTVKAQMSRKEYSEDPNVNDDKMTNVESKMSSLGGKAENHHSSRVPMPKANLSSDEDDLPPMKRRRPALEAKSSSLASENKLGNSALRKNDLLPRNKIRSSAAVPTKRRAVLRVDDDEEELTKKTPVHGGSSSKVSAISRVDSKKKLFMQGESNVINKSVSRNSESIDRMKEQAKVVRLPNKGVVPTARQGTEKVNKDISHVHVPPSTFQSQPKAAPVSPAKSPPSTVITRPSAELLSKLSAKGQGNISENKAAAGSNIGLASATEKSSLDQLTNDRSKPISSGEKGESIPKSDFIDSAMMVGNSSENFASLGERLDFGKDKRTIFSDSKTPDSVMNMKNLIAAAQARKKQALIQNPGGDSLSLLVHDTDMLDHTPSPAPAMMAVESTNTLQLEIQGLHHASHTSDVHHPSSSNQHENEEQEERRVSSGHQTTGSSLSGGTEAAIARDAFEGMIETLSRTKDSIGRATRLALDCAKHGIPNEVMELLIKKLESARSNRRRVDLFFLVDSITQCSHQKGAPWVSYIPIVQSALPRLIGAAAPPGSGAQENRRQCHKVLRLWLERKILPESILRPYMDEIGVTKDAGFLLRRPSREERAIDDPLREMDGMFVDEYGSNATFQLPGFLSCRAFDEDEDEDDDPSNLGSKVVDASPSSHTPAASTDPDNNPVTPSDRRHCILEDVDGELEMEDVSGNQKDEKPSIVNVTVQTEHNASKIVEPGSSMYAELQPSPDSPPFPDGTPPPSPALPTSPPPPLSPPLPPQPSSPSPPPPPPVAPSKQHMFLPPPCPAPSYAAPLSSVGPPLTAARPPPMLSQMPLQHRMSQHMPPPAPLARDIGSMPTGIQRPMMVPSQGSHFDSSLKSDAMSQQSSCFPPAGISNAQEKNVYNAARPVEYGKGDVYMNSQQRPQFVPGAQPFAQRPLHSERPPQFPPPNQFSYGNSAHQYHYPPYQRPNFPDGARRGAGDEQWRMKANEFNSDGPRDLWRAAGRSNSGYYGPPTERPPLGAPTFHPPRPDTLQVHGAPMMSGRPDMSSVNWRPA